MVYIHKITNLYPIFKVLVEIPDSGLRPEKRVFYSTFLKTFSEVANKVRCFADFCACLLIISIL